MIEPSQIASLRKRVGISQSELARRSGVSQSLVAKIEAGLLDPSYSKLKAISRAFEKSNAYSSPCASDMMCREVIKLDASDSIAQAIEHMNRHGVSQLPVFAAEALVGTVSESSVLDFVVRRGSNPESMQTRVDQVMSESMPQVPPETGVDALVTLLRHFPAVLVSVKGEIRGIVTKSDLLSGAKIGAPPGTVSREITKQPQLA
jgi:predicted transcriptional regulator